MSDLTEASPPIRFPMTRLGVMMFSSFHLGVLVRRNVWLLERRGHDGDRPWRLLRCCRLYVAPIAAILAPLTLGLICDRLMNTEHVLAILNIVGAGLLWLAPSLASAGAPESF